MRPFHLLDIPSFVRMILWMAAALDAIARDALVLPAEQRLTLAYQLLDSVEPRAHGEADEAWEEEITRRIARLDAGEVEPVPAAAVFARLGRIAPDRA